MFAAAVRNQPMSEAPAPEDQAASLVVVRRHASGLWFIELTPPGGSAFELGPYANGDGAKTDARLLQQFTAAVLRTSAGQ